MVPPVLSLRNCFPSSHHTPFACPVTQSPSMSSLSPEQAKTIKATVPALQEHGNEITSRFYETMLAEIPDLNNGASYFGKLV